MDKTGQLQPLHMDSPYDFLHYHIILVYMTTWNIICECRNKEILWFG